jgi:hypothetical protein
MKTVAILILLLLAMKPVDAQQGTAVSTGATKNDGPAPDALPSATVSQFRGKVHAGIYDEKDLLRSAHSR